MPTTTAMWRHLDAFLLDSQNVAELNNKTHTVSYHHLRSVGGSNLRRVHTVLTGNVLKYRVKSKTR